MRTIIAGSRSITDYDSLAKVMQQITWEPTVILSGGARGADRLGERWAAEHQLPIDFHYADWNQYGKSAGYKRNEEMAQNADAAIILWDGQSKGALHMFNLATRYGLQIWRETL